MENTKIKKMYCTDDKVQVMFSNASSQIICSKDGYLYLRDGDLTLHRYLEDPARKTMPYGNTPSSQKHASHFLKYGQVYVKFTSSRTMGSVFACCDGGYTLTFLYATKTITGEVILSEWAVFDGEDFYQNPTSKTKIMNKEELEEFLYGTSGLTGKYIFTFNRGIKYANSVNEEHVIKKVFIDLSDDAIIKLYNIMKRPISLFGNNTQESEDDATTIDEVKEFSITGNGWNNPVMVTITDSKITFYEFEITYCSKDCYRVNLNKVKVKPDMLKIHFSISTAKYPPELNF